MDKRQIMVRVTEPTFDALQRRGSILGQSRSAYAAQVLNEHCTPAPTILEQQMVAHRKGKPVVEPLPEVIVPRETVDDDFRVGPLPPPPEGSLLGVRPVDPLMDPVTSPTPEYLRMKEQARQLAAKNCSHPTESRLGHKVGEQVCGVCGFEL